MNQQKELNLLAYDCGNSSIRTILCHFDGEKVSSEVILQEPNHITEENGLFYWDMPQIFSVMKRGLGMAAAKAGRIDSIGICTWGIDFQMTDDDGNLMERAFCYRNTIGEEALSTVSAQEQRDMFYRTGILCDKINTVFMLKGLWNYAPSILRNGRKILLVPDVFVYLFTGVLMNEPSELSTSQMLNVESMTIDAKQCEYAGVSPDIFSQIGVHGQKVGNVRREILDELGISYDIPLICVPSHDTACAVLAIPSEEEKYLFVSSGTWALVGAQCPRPIINDAVLKASLTNEVGAFGRTTLLRNNAGMFIVQRLKAEYEEETGAKISWNDFTKLAQEWENESVIFDVNDSRLFNPRNMAFEIRDMMRNAAAEAGACAPKDGVCAPGNGMCPPEDGCEIGWPQLMASVYASLGESFAQVLTKVAACTGDTYERVYIVGGGSRNAAINQRCADRLGLPVYACDMECSSVGNAAAQLAYHLPQLQYGDLRKIIAGSLLTTVYSPTGKSIE